MLGEWDTQNNNIQHKIVHEVKVRIAPLVYEMDGKGVRRAGAAGCSEELMRDPIVIH